MLREAGLHMGVPELGKARPRLGIVTRAGFKKMVRCTFGLRAKKAKVVNVRRVEGRDEQHAVMQAFARLAVRVFEFFEKYLHETVEFAPLLAGRRSSSVRMLFRL